MPAFLTRKDRGPDRAGIKGLQAYWSSTLAVAALALIAGCGGKTPVPSPEAFLAPYVVTPEKVVVEMLRLAEVGKKDVVYDLGSGDGRILILAAKLYGARGVGFELDASLVAQAGANARRAGVAHLVEFRNQDVLTVDPSPATVVTIYLSPDANLKLRAALRTRLRPGARVVSHEFDMGDWPPDAIHRFPDELGAVGTLYLWRIPASPTKP